MHNFEVWAPKAEKSLDVDIDGARFPLTRGEEGVWSGKVESAGPGTNYKFVIDGADSWPDPASHYQPNGVHGASQIVDHSKFHWTDHGFRAKPLSEAIIYELHIGTFTQEGTYKSAIDKIAYLKDLGITHIEIMPVAQASGDRGWGYDGTYWHAPYAAYGTPDDLKELVNECHAAGIAVVLDAVYNHKGNEGNYTGKFSDQYDHPTISTKWGKAVNLDSEGSEHVRKDILASVKLWLRDYHFDGLRLDATHELYDDSEFHILAEISTEVKKLSDEVGRPLTLIAENDRNDPKVVKPVAQGGYGMDGVIIDDIGHAVFTKLTGENRGWFKDFDGSFEQLEIAMKEGVLYDGTRYSEHRGNKPGHSFKGIPHSKIVVDMQNHDRVGNRAQGDRLTDIIDPNKARIAAGLILMSLFPPRIFMGEEFGATTPWQYFTGHTDEEIARKTTEGRRSEFEDFDFTPEQVPDPQDRQTFMRSKLNWDEVNSGPHKIMHQFYKNLIALRRSIVDFGNSHTVTIAHSKASGWFTMEHSGVKIVFNFADQPRLVPVHMRPVETISSDRAYNPDQPYPEKDGYRLIPAHTAVTFVSEHAKRTHAPAPNMRQSLDDLRGFAGTGGKTSQLEQATLS